MALSMQEAKAAVAIMAREAEGGEWQPIIRSLRIALEDAEQALNFYSFPGNYPEAVRADAGARALFALSGGRYGSRDGYHKGGDNG